MSASTCPSDTLSNTTNTSSFTPRFVRRSIGYFTSVFTHGEFICEYVALNNGNKSFFRALNISVHNLESVFDGLYNDTDSRLNEDAKGELNPIFYMHLNDVDITFSNFEDISRYNVYRGFALRAAGILATNSSLSQTLTSLKSNEVTDPDKRLEDPEETELHFRIRFSVDYTVEEGEESYPRLFIYIRGKNLEVMPRVELIGFEFTCLGLLQDMEFQIMLGTTISVWPPVLEAPIITTVKGEFDLEVNTTSGEVEIDDGWTASAHSKLAQGVSWNPMGMEVFYLANPELWLWFSEDESTAEENDIEVDKMIIKTKNFTVAERMHLWSPAFTVKQFVPQSLELESDLLLSFTGNGSEPNPHPLHTSIRGTYDERNKTMVTSEANFSSVSKYDWWPFHHNMIVVEQGAEIDFNWDLYEGNVEYMRMIANFDITFDPLGKARAETMKVHFRATSSRDLEEFCWMMYDIPVLTIQRVMMNIFIGENGTEAARNLLLSEGESERVAKNEGGARGAK